ncbi:VOC family protein [Mycobacterium spongiae]|uniref:VOC family protein n=1 Tax=Mycobacterium spongiae TaxID=886343 RepID=A0A975JU79_9MYCO|nr:VOC family protein [Mycobacterium spongiae]QUR65790.1 VOC family protein [Mycobacterium spongiae]
MDLNQVTLNVTDFDEAVAFYRLLGLKLIVSSRGEYARFELPSGSTTLSLHLSTTPTTNGPTIYFECDDVDARYTALCAAGVTFDSAPQDENWRWREARFRDPSGNALCLYHAGQDRRFPPWRVESVG